MGAKQNIWTPKNNKLLTERLSKTTYINKDNYKARTFFICIALGCFEWYY